MRPSCVSFAVSQSTIADMLQRWAVSSLRSPGRSVPATAYSSTWVSRLSIPRHASGENGALDVQFAGERADEVRRIGGKRHQLRHRLSPFGDDDALGIDLVEQREARLL